MTIHTDTKETNTTGGIEKYDSPESDDHTVATVEEDTHELPFVGKANCFDRAPKLLKVDRAYKWGPGTTIYDDRGSALFEVRVQGCADMSGAGPIYEAVITEIETRKPVAYVRKSIEAFRETYRIYTAYPNYDSQPPTTRRWEDAEGRDFYALGTLRQSMFGKNYVYKRCHQGFKVKPARHLKFSNLDDQKNPVIIKNQGSTIAGTPRETLLQAICIVYAVDRLTNPHTKAVVMMGVSLKLVSGFAYVYAS
jgi:hypothetical protein